MKKCKECGKNVSSTAKICPNCGRKLKMGFGQKLLITLGVLIIIGVIGSSSQNNKNKPVSNTTKENSAKQEVPKKWTEVYSFSGNGMKKSPAFELQGNSAKIRYKYTTPEGLGIGIFSVYVVEEGTDLMQEGGFPEVMSQSDEESESSIQKSAGRYYLSVNATGNWKITVEEMR